MKYFILTIVLLNPFILSAEITTGTVENNTKILQSLLSSIQTRYPLIDVSRLINNKEFTLSCNSENSKCNSSYIITISIVSFDPRTNISLLIRFNSVPSTSGYNIVGHNIKSNDVIFLHRKNGTNTLLVDSESNIVNESCNAPNYTFGVSNITCLNRWEKYTFGKLISKKLNSEADLIEKRMNNTMTQKDLIDNSIAIADAIISTVSVDGAEKIVEGILQSENLIMGYAMDSTSSNGALAIKFTNDLAVNYISAIRAGSSPADAAALAADQIGKLAEITNNLTNAFILDSLVEDMNGVIIARLYLEEYYYYGGDNGWVAYNSGISRTSSLWDTIDAVAIRNGYNNSIFDTEYNISEIKDVIEDYKYIIVREFAVRCMKIAGRCQ